MPVFLSTLSWPSAQINVNNGVHEKMEMEKGDRSCGLLANNFPRVHFLVVPSASKATLLHLRETAHIPPSKVAIAK